MTTLRFRLGGVAGGLRRLFGRACGAPYPQNSAGLAMQCDLPRGHEPAPHRARWWAAYGHVIRRYRRQLARRVQS